MRKTKGCIIKLKLIVLTVIASGLFIGCYSSPKKVKEIETKKETEKPIVWVNPSEANCFMNNGRMKKNVCEAKWLNALYMCRWIGAELPSVEKLNKVLTDCGGKKHANGKEQAENVDNVAYQTCYKDKGFNFGNYWTISKDSYTASKSYVISYLLGMQFYLYHDKMAKVRCIKK